MEGKLSHNHHGGTYPNLTWCSIYHVFIQIYSLLIEGGLWRSIHFFLIMVFFNYFYNKPFYPTHKGALK